MWWKLRVRFEKAYEFAELAVPHPAEEMISIPNHPDLIAELSMPLVQNTATGKVKIEGKQDMKRRGVKSPDVADALALAFCDAGASIYHRRGLLMLGSAPEVKQLPERSDTLITIGGDGPVSWDDPEFWE